MAPIIKWKPDCCTLWSLNLSQLDNIITKAGIAINETSKGQLISKANCQAKDSSKKRTNEFVFTRGLVLYEQPFKSGCLDF